MDSNSDITYSQIFSLTELISAPLIATVQADFYAAERFVTYLRQYGFEPPKDGLPWDFGKLRMVSFQYRTPDGWMEMEIPLISLIPLPLLSVSDADFSYNLKLLGSITSEISGRDPGVPQELPLGNSLEPRRLLGSFAPLRPQTDAEEQTPTLVANMGMNIRMRQSGLPGGIAALLNIVQSSVSGNSNGRITFAPSVITLSAPAPTMDTLIRVIDDAGNPLEHHLVSLVAGPIESTEFLLPPAVVTGKLVSAATPFDLALLTNNAGEVKLSWQRAASPSKQANVNLAASSQVSFAGGQFGLVKAVALLQIAPDPTTPRSA